MIEAILPRLAASVNMPSGKAKYIAFTHEDGDFWCPHCRKKFAAGGTGYATETEYITATYTKFMIKLASALKTYNNGAYKDVTILMACYGATTLMPVSGSAGNYSIDSGIASFMSSNSLSLPDNLGVIFSFDVHNNYNGTTSFASIKDVLDRYRTISNKFYMWTYIENSSNYFAPFDGVQQIQDSIKFAKENGAFAYFPQGMNVVGSYSIDWGALENYLLSKLHWDVNADVDTLIDEFFDNYYGNASTAMKSLYSSYKLKMAALNSTYGFGSKYNYMTNGYVNYISTTCWSKAELEGFLNKIGDAQYALYNAYGSGLISEESYSAFIARVNREALTFKYIYIKLYTSDAVDYYSAASASTLRTSFISECKSLGIDYFAEGVSVDY